MEAAKRNAMSVARNWAKTSRKKMERSSAVKNARRSTRKRRKPIKKRSASSADMR